MNCFYHPTVVAVGACKSCGKGLCQECAVDLGKGLACKGKCEKDVVAMIGLIERNIQLSPASEQLVKTARSNRYLSPIYQTVFGLFFIGIATNQFFTSGLDQLTIFLGGIGFFLLLFGLFTLYRTTRLSRAVKSTVQRNN